MIDNQSQIPKYNRNNLFFQSNYYDCLVRNEVEYKQIKNYIINNSLHWNDDSLNDQNVEPCDRGFLRRI